MGSIKSVPMTIDQCCESLTDPFEKSLVKDMLDLFCGAGYTYLVSATNTNRIYCYIKKSRECLIINKQSYVDRIPDGGLSVQIRILSKRTFASLDTLSPNVRSAIVHGRDCKAPHCCNCGKAYSFSYNDQPLLKCHMLCDNFTISGITPEDKASIMTLITNEMQK